jgi:hypothetical protein
LGPFLKLSQGRWFDLENDRESHPEIRYEFNHDDSDKLISISRSIENHASSLASLSHNAYKFRNDSYFPSPTKICEEIYPYRFEDSRHNMSEDLDVIPEVESESRCDNCRKRKLQVFENIIFSC